MTRNKTSVILLLAIAGLFLAAGCDDLTTWEKKEIDMINNYIKGLGDTVYLRKPSGLYYIELEPGTGDEPVKGDTVIFRYKGSFLDGQVFDSNLDTTKAAYVSKNGSGDIIPGIDEGLRYMKPGGKSRLLTPSSLAYGHAGIFGIIPGYMPLLWEVVLLEVKKGP